MVSRLPPTPANVPSLSAFNTLTAAAGVTAGKKRPVWDFEGRLQDMEGTLQEMQALLQDMQAQMSQHVRQNNSLQEQLLSYCNRVAMLEIQHIQLEGTVAQNVKVTKMSQQIEELQKKLRDREGELDKTRPLQRDTENLEFSKYTLERHKSTLEEELSASREECSRLKVTADSLASAQAGIKAELVATQMSLNESVACGQQKDETIAELQNRIAAHEATIEEYERSPKESFECCQQKDEAIEELQDLIEAHEVTISGREYAIAELRSDMLALKMTIAEHRNPITAHEAPVRREFHNTILQRKGDIQVFCRVRPLLGKERLRNDGIISHIAFPDDNKKIIELERRRASVGRDTIKCFQYGFDRVFQPNESQAKVFDEISDLVQSTLSGFNVCIFAYGQTGSGKTHTMEGPVDKGDLEQQGMIPRAMRLIFQTASEYMNREWKYEFEASFLEIYNETIRDLLGCGKETKHEIKMVAAGSSEVVVTNMTSVKVLAQDQVHELLQKASKQRAVAETKCNEHSSRSHSIFRLKITGHHTHTNDKYIGELNLIDLAGSERLKVSGPQRARIKEAKSINTSLAHLKRVINALANKEAHVPYRDNKLTQLLHHSLDGNSKILMFVNVSPNQECISETQNSLEFATKVNSCMIGTATRKVK